MSAPDFDVSLEADLVLDTTRAGRQGGLREGRAGVGRQLLYRTGELYLDLRVGPGRTAGELVLIGQLVGASSIGPLGGLPLRLEYDDGTSTSTHSDELGEFLLPGASAGGATLDVELHEARLEIPLPADLFDGDGGRR